MSDKTREEYETELAALGEILIDPAIYPARKILMVPCADVLLAQAIGDTETQTYYDQYFVHMPYDIFSSSERALFTCSDQHNSISALEGCISKACTSLGGIRGSSSYIATPASRIVRLFAGDVVWLYWVEKMGLFEIFARIVDDYAMKGKYAIDNDDLTAVALEVMTRQLSSGVASLIRDRTSTYRRCLGWTSETGRKLELQSEINTAFNSQFHQFLTYALQYYKDLRLADAIRQTTSGGASVATRVAAAESLQLLKESFSVFDYGRNNYNTLCGIVYAISTLGILRNIKDDIGVPTMYTKASQYVSAAYAILIDGRSASSYTPNRFLLHMDCAEKGRDLLLDIQALDVEDVEAVGEWLENEITEERVESYRKAYRDITKVDLAEIESQVPQMV